MRKLLLFILVGLIASDCTENVLVNNISTTDAREKYALQLGKLPFLAFPELREYPIRWFDSIPDRRIKNGLSHSAFVMNAEPGEYFIFQIGVWAIRNDIGNVRIELSDLKGKSRKKVHSSKITCFNNSGINFRGKPFSKEINIKSERVQALWFGIDLEGVEKGNYTGSVSIVANGEKQTIPINLKVKGEAVTNHGYNEGNRLSRLSWLNSTLGNDDEVTKGYLPVKVDNNIISILGRDLSISSNGLPGMIRSYFGSSNQVLTDRGEPIVNKPFRFIIQKQNGEIIRLNPGELKFTSQTPSTVVWCVVNTSTECDLECTGQMEFDGFIDYHLKLTAKIPLKVKDIRLEVPIVQEKAEYVMGLGHEGGYLTQDLDWKWDVTKNQDMIWIGSVTGGLRLKLKAENYVRPLVNIYYSFGPLNLPPSWGNDNKGGVNIRHIAGDEVVTVFSGIREMGQGDSLNYDFELLITPLKLIDKQIKFNDRYFHGGGVNAFSKVEMAKKAEANIINIHHAEDIYPFINYPYLDANIEDLKKLVDSAHNENLRIKLYYTTRELTKNLPEFWAFNSLSGEVIFPGPGNESRTEALHPKGPNEWLIKNIREKYIPAWYNLVQEGKFKGETDLSLITTPDSQLNNFYIAGLDWMVQNLGIDGVYINDSALDHYTLRRARKIIDHYRPDGRMDLHSWNHFNNWAGFANCLNLYMDLLPYFDLVWIGEGRDYNRAPDHWLIEVSGIPFGLAGQMLEGGGNPWRGMVYGITNRAGWVKNSPEHLWRFFDKYHFSELEMIGYWENDCPVRCSNSSVKASIFKNADVSIISLANWTDQGKKVSLYIDWAKLKINPTRVDVFTPEIENFQAGRSHISLNEIVIPGKKGFLIVIKKKDNQL